MQTFIFSIFLALLISVCVYQMYLNLKSVADDEAKEKYERYKERYAQACSDYCKDKYSVSVECKGSGWDNEGKLI